MGLRFGASGDANHGLRDLLTSAQQPLELPGWSNDVAAALCSAGLLRTRGSPPSSNRRNRLASAVERYLSAWRLSAASGAYDVHSAATIGTSWLDKSGLSAMSRTTRLARRS